MSVIPSADFAVCAVIPCFNHGRTVTDVVDKLQLSGLHCFIVDDGSDDETRQILERLEQTRTNLTLLVLPENRGKGEAVLNGLDQARQAGFSHALQIDADGQHAFEDIPKMLELAQAHPDRLISGKPEYDWDVPKSRLYGRYVTHVWVWIETLSFSLKDSMCGFRVYPVEPTLAVRDKAPLLGRRMDFDTEIMVRLYWSGVDSLFVPTRVCYPPGGISHFRIWRDNWRISMMHTRLFFGMLRRSPSLIMRRKRPSVRHWSEIKERKGLWGMRLMFKAYRLLGRRFFNVSLYPVIGYFWLTGRKQRRASQAYLDKVRGVLAERGQPVPAGLSSFRHMRRFGDAMLDKLASWQGEIRLGRNIDFAQTSFLNSDNVRNHTGLILASHLGDIEVCRALAQLEGFGKVNALVFNRHAKRFARMMERSSPDAGMNLIQVTDIGPDTAILLKEKLDAGEWVAIVGDRTAVNPNPRGGERRVVWSDFLGSPAPFPQGPFVLAAALRCPVILMFALKERGRLTIYSELFANPLSLPRADRQQALQEAVDRYAARLEDHCLRAPLDWFNFFDFWSLPEINELPQGETK